MAVIVTFSAPGIFSSDVTINITYQDGAPPFAAVITGTTIDLTIGTTVGFTTDSWDVLAADFNAAVPANLATAVGTPSNNSVFPGSGSLSDGSSGQGQGQFFFALTPVVVVPVLSNPPGGRMPPPVKPNDFTMCLVREFNLLKNLEFDKLECCPRIPCMQPDYNEAVGIGWLEPSDGIPFNPTFGIQLPDPSADEVTIFSILVPLGFDGMVLAQFHTYIPAPSGVITNTFLDGSGDIAWRVTSNNRYLKDCGNMLTRIGGPQRLSPVYGGIRVRSGDFITYRVQVYNLSGLLTPGLGSIIAGLHGYFYPRK